MNKVTMLGRLVKDPEMRTTNSGKNVASFTLAVPRRFAQKDAQITADYFNMSAWGKLGDFVSKYFRKGQQVLVSGRLENRTWNDNEGNKKYATDVILEEVYFADSKKADGNTYDTDDYSPVDMSDPDALPF